MLEEILDHIHNYFPDTRNTGSFQISNGTLTADFLIPGQYFRIVGSLLNDGVYLFPASDLKDEAFTGEVWGLAVPRPVLDLAAEIQEWVKNHPATDLSSESFGGYSYSRAADKNGKPMSWEDVFSSRLNRWRRPNDII